MLTLRKMGQHAAPAGYYSAKWRNTIENHLVYLRNHAQTRVVPTTELVAYRSRWDLHSLLTEMKIPEKHFWVIMRVNNLNNPTEFHEDITSIIVPSSSAIEQLYSVVMKS